LGIQNEIDIKELECEVLAPIGQVENGIHERAVVNAAVQLSVT